jgi:Flp pilus assembly protein protease CpaA
MEDEKKMDASKVLMEVVDNVTLIIELITVLLMIFAFDLRRHIILSGVIVMLVLAQTVLAVVHKDIQKFTWCFFSGIVCTCNFFIFLNAAF